jgi:ribonuclease HI
VSRTDWGGDRKTLLHLYRSLIRSKLDYGCMVYGSARKTVLQMLDPIANQGLRLALGAFRSSPVESLYTEAEEPPLNLRRKKLAIHYILKLSSHPENPTHKCVFDPQYKNLYEANEKAIRSFGLRLQPTIIDLNVQDIIIEIIPKIPPWILTPPIINYEISKAQKSDTSEILYISKFNEIKAIFSDYKPIYTDGSKTENAVASAVVTTEKTVSKAYNKNLSIFSAEIRALELALNEIDKSEDEKHIIYSDSKSALQALEDRWTTNPLLRRVLELHTNIRKSKLVIFCWVPSHVGIKGNEAADQAAKTALDSPVSDPAIPAVDWLPIATQYIKTQRKDQWDKIQTNKLKEIIPNLLDHHQIQCNNRRDEVVMTRLRIGHSRLTHAFLMKGDPSPECIGCNTAFTIKHILVECVDFADTRKLFYNVQDMNSLFKTVTKEKILGFIKEIGLYHKI